MRPDFDLLELIPARVQAFFAAQGEATQVTAGWGERAKQSHVPGTANRVTFALKSLSPIPPTHLGDDFDELGVGAPRQLGDVLLGFEVSITGYDPADGGQNDMRHAARCLWLYQRLWQALQHLYTGMFVLGEGTANDAVKNVRHGAELLVSLQINVPMHDVDVVFHKPVAPVPNKPSELP